jgi:serine/threonine protein kinase
MTHLLAGRYHIEQSLGQGGFGQTFLAKDLHLPTDPFCVVKKLAPKFRDRQTLKTARRLFELEAQTLYRLGQHDQIPQLLAHFEEAGEFYLVQDFVDGPTLQTILDEPRQLREPAVVAILQDLLQVLAFVHSNAAAVLRDLNQQFATVTALPISLPGLRADPKPASRSSQTDTAVDLSAVASASDPMMAIPQAETSPQNGPTMPAPTPSLSANTAIDKLS